MLEKKLNASTVNLAGVPNLPQKETTLGNWLPATRPGNFLPSLTVPRLKESAIT